MEHLPKKIHQNGISYTLVGDYYIPDLKLPEESRPIGRWGRMHKAFLQEHRPGQYNVLLLSGKLWTYLADLNEQAADRLGKNACTSHKIEARDLYNLVLKDIQELAAQAMKDADAFYQRLSSWMERRYLVDASQTEKERKRLEARNQEIDGMFLSLYTDKAKGILTEQRFMKLTAALEQEQESNQKRLHDLAVMQSRADAQESEVRTFIKEIRRYSAIEVLDEAVLNRLISKILIGEVKKVDGQKVQEVRIVYNFVGEIPEIAT